jgi:hypothetical protein
MTTTAVSIKKLSPLCRNDHLPTMGDLPFPTENINGARIPPLQLWGKAARRFSAYGSVRNLDLTSPDDRSNLHAAQSAGTKKHQGRNISVWLCCAAKPGSTNAARRLDPWPSTMFLLSATPVEIFTHWGFPLHWTTAPLISKVSPTHMRTKTFLQASLH